jgi:fructose-bisphosphate aldolase class 1
VAKVSVDEGRITFAQAERPAEKPTEKITDLMKILSTATQLGAAFKKRSTSA